MSSRVVLAGHLVVAAVARDRFLAAWSEDIVEDHPHTWRCVARDLGDTRIMERADGAVTIAVKRWCSLDYRAADLLDRVVPHVEHARLSFEYEFGGDDDTGWVVAIDDGELAEE